MPTKFATAVARGDDGFSAGRLAAEKALAKLGAAKADLCILFSATRYEYQKVIDGVQGVLGGVPLVGCSTAGEFTEEKTGNGSVALALIVSDTHKFFTGLGKGLRSNEMACFKKATAPFPAHARLKDYPSRSLMLFQDGLCGKGEEIPLAALSALGTDLKIVGGSAGDDYAFKETFVFSNDTAAADAVSTALVLSRAPIAVGVDHGHKPISPPFTITKSFANVVFEIDGKPAIPVWLDYTREAAKKFGIDVDRIWDEPSTLALFSVIYEGGIFTGKDYKIRWSGLKPDTRDFLPFVCSIPQGSVMRVMEGSKESQLESARNAAQRALKALNGKKPAGAVIFDCAVRGAMLGDDFYKEVEEIKKVLGGIPLIGLETYGEIALEEGQLSGFYNTTTVVVLFPE